MTERPSELLARHRDEVLELCRATAGIEGVYLTGSVARGEDRPGSDLDLLIETVPGVVSLFDLYALHDRLVDLLGCPVDMTTLGALTGPDDPILRDARPL